MLSGEPTENRTWTSKAKTSFEGKATALSGGEVTLVSSSGKTLKVPLNKLSDSDVIFLKKHFASSDVPKAKVPEGLTIPLGKISERIDAGDNAFYRIYLPKTIDTEVAPPILYFAAYGGYKEGLVGRFYEAAEVAGVALAISAEKRNPGVNFFPKSHVITEACLKHIRKNYPVDTKRAIFSGSSGDGAASFYSADRLKCIGAIPYTGYIPNGTSINKKVFYYMGGGARDYNRYTSAHAAVKAKDRGIHRMWKGGHASARPPEAFESLIWVYSRHIYEFPEKCEREISLFEPRFLNWLNKEKASRPYVVYFWADHLLNTCKITGGFSPEIRALYDELGKTQANVDYLNCYRAIGEFSANHYEPVVARGESSLQEHTTPEIEAAAAELRARFPDVPDLSSTLAELGEKTVK